ncbi:MAG: hypothetical protein CMG14_01130 [Candidatus Marinimicrobia bacterium]|nr:hypothetical protein [Candidatus Neomarinimicrobiota bacterium]|tara:strand:+ start:13744 stop:14289 length:546 start_codon:yes stop_codon:yes gene_type:complete
MINLKYIPIIIFTKILLSSPIMDKTLSTIKQSFPNNISIKHNLYQIDKKTLKEIQNTVRQKFFRKEVNCWHIINDDSTHYYAILDNVKGKSLPITFLTIFDENNKVFDSSIIKYREAYGGEIASKSWLNQFLSYTDSSNYNVGDAISGISGATISVNSVTKGINKLSILIDYIIKDFNDEL